MLNQLSTEPDRNKNKPSD